MLIMYVISFFFISNFVDTYILNIYLYFLVFEYEDMFDVFMETCKISNFVS